MNIKCNSNDLIVALNTVTKALPSKAINPMLDGILIDTTEHDKITMTCTDEKITITTSANAIVKEPGKGVIPGKLFTEVVKKLSGGDIDIKMSERNVFTVRGSGSRTNISGQNADLFPALPSVDAEHKIAISQSVLKDMIQKTEFAVAIEDMREVLTGALLEINQGEINMVALDGFRMAIRRTQCATSIDNCKAIIPGKALSSISKLLSDSPDTYAYISIGNGKLHIQFDDTNVYAVLIQGDYVNYKQIIPKDFATQVEVDLDGFRKAIDRASLIAREGNNNLLIFRVANGEMAIESKSQIGDVFEKLDVMQTGNDINIAFNVKYLFDVVKSIDTETINIDMNTPASPCIITPAGDGNYIHLVLPVRTANT